MATLAEIEQMTEGQKKLSEIEKKKLIATAELDGVLKNLDKERAKLSQLMKTKEEFLQKRDKESINRLAKVSNAIVETRERMVALTAEVGSAIDRVASITGEAIDRALAIVKRAEDLEAAAHELETTWRTAAAKIAEQAERAEQLLIKNSDTEKKLTRREGEVERKDRDAKETLRKAEELVYWHHNRKGEKLPTP